MILCFISDTHGRHYDLRLNLSLEKILLTYPDAVLIHCGDVSNRGRESEVRDFIEWYDSLNFKHKIFIAGNHDFLFESDSKKSGDLISGTSLIYLNDSGFILDGIKFWGSPITPWFYDWAFNRRSEIIDHLKLIPDDTDVLITHGPPYGTLDFTLNGHKSVGCPELSRKIGSLKNLMVHSFGHIHESFGKETINGVSSINASILNLSYVPTNEPVLFDTEKKKTWYFSEED